MERYTKAEFVVLMVMLVLNLFFIIFILGFSGISGFSVFSGEEKVAPSDFVSEDKIYFEDGKVIIELEDAVFSKYVDSGSMEPVLGASSTGVGIKPVSPNGISVGDIISFEKEGIVIAHRVIQKGVDKDGDYFITRGDNGDSDDGKVRFNQIESVLVAIIY